jgi:fermentation-respiration switch protein FrsA (DUF1100 family)
MPVHTFEVQIPAEGTLLAGRLHRNVDNLTDVQPALVASGSWLTVKEQMADLYAARFAALGFTVLTFDFTGFGGSGGEARQVEMPARKLHDIVAATHFLSTLGCVHRGEVGYVAICASAMYVAAAIELGAPVTSLASIAGWFHDPETVAPFYGGAAGVASRLRRASDAAARLRKGKAEEFVPAYEEGSERAGMFIPMDYYANPLRGCIPAWRNAMSEQSWMHWLTFDGLTPALRLSTPTLFVHGDECALPDNIRRILAQMPGKYERVWHPGFQVDWYDRPDLVDIAVQAADAHFRATIGITLPSVGR